MITCKHLDTESFLGSPNFIYEGEVTDETPDTWVICKSCGMVFPAKLEAK